MSPQVLFLLSLALSLVLTRSVRRWAAKLGIVDIPDGTRRRHSRPVPRVGGIAIYASVLLALIGHLALSKDLHVLNHEFVALLCGGTLIFILGLLDDIRGITARTKFCVEIAVAVGMFMAGVQIRGVGLPSGEIFQFPVWFALILTVFWTVAITNAFNLIDGSDGIAGGAVLFAAGSIAVVSFINGTPFGIVVALTLAGAVLGFLFFNFPPASIFMGDSGSLFLGFVLATLGVITTDKAATALAVAIPVVSFGLPVLDTTLAVTRRFLRGQPLFQPDRGHIHHRLQDLGHSPRTVALLLYAASAGFGLLSLMLVQPGGRAVATLFLVAGISIWLAVQRLHVPELLEVQRIVRRGLRQRTAISNNIRIREAIARLGSPTDEVDIAGALMHAFRGGEFQRIELWVDERYSDALQRSEDTQPSGDGHLWRWIEDDAPTRALEGRNLLELRLPLNDEDGRVIGRLSLSRPADDDGLLTDIRLVARELQPCLCRALLRESSADRVVREGDRVEAPFRGGELLIMAE